MSPSPSDRRRGRAGVLREILRECQGIAGRIDRQMDALRQARGCDRTDLVALRANLLALGRELTRLGQGITSRPGASLLRRDRVLRRALSRWLSDAAHKVDWISGGIEPGFDLPHGDGVDWWEVWLDAIELSDRMADLRRHLSLDHVPHPRP